MKALPGLCQSNAARRSNKKRHANTRLQRANGLTHRRGGYAEIAGSFAETSMPRDAEKYLNAVQGALPHCEVLLHTPSTLSRIAARRKWSYFSIAMQQQRRARLLLQRTKEHSV